MNFLRRLADSFRRFMYGRYGADQLNLALLIGYLVLAITLDWIPRSNLFVNLGIKLLPLLLLAWAIFRMLSKHTERRYKENQAFLKVWNPVKRFFKLQYCRLRDIKSYRYRRCPHCKAVVRLPIKKGKHTCTCPRCHRDFPVRM